MSPPPPRPVVPRPPAHRVASPQRVRLLLGHRNTKVHLHGWERGGRGAVHASGLGLHTGSLTCGEAALGSDRGGGRSLAGHAVRGGALLPLPRFRQWRPQGEPGRAAFWSPLRCAAQPGTRATLLTVPRPLCPPTPEAGRPGAGGPGTEFRTQTLKESARTFLRPGASADFWGPGGANRAWVGR